jgi:nitroreductase
MKGKERRMSDLMEIVKGRRSIRKYEEKPVPEASLHQILESVKWSPSWANCQCWEIVVVRDSATKLKLQETFPPAGNPANKSIVQAPIVLALCAKMGVSGYYKDQVTTKFGDWMMYDLGLATQNICLTAHALGLGTVIVGLFNQDKAGKTLNIPDGYELVSLIPLGYPAKSGSAPKRREISEFSHEETF